MKRILFMALASVLGLSLFANGAPEKSAPASTGAGGKQINLRFSWWGGDERLKATLAVIDQFEKLNPNIKIQPEYGSADGYTDKLATQLAAGTAPDIVQVDPEAFPKFISDTTNYFVDYNTYKFNFANFEPGYLKQRVNGNFAGRQFGIPTGIAGPALLVNKTLADKIGIDFSKPYTWDDLIAWGKKVQAYDKNLHLLCADKVMITNLVVFNYAKQLTGKTLIDESTKQLTVSESQFAEIYSLVKALYDNGVVGSAAHMAAYTDSNIQSDPDWISGKYVAAYAYISTIGVMTAANPSVKYAVGRLPILSGAKEAGYASNCPQVIAVSAKSANVEAAIKFMDYFFNNETAMLTLGTVRSVPSTAKAREICQKNGKLDALMTESANLAASYGGVPNDKYSSVQESKQILFDGVEAIGYGNTAPDKAARETFNLMKNYIGNIR